MRQFDPWPVFFKREWNRNWPFLAGFAVTGFIITKLTLGLTEEDAKNSTFVQKHKRLVKVNWWRPADCHTLLNSWSVNNPKKVCCLECYSLCYLVEYLQGKNNRGFNEVFKPSQVIIKEAYFLMKDWHVASKKLVVPDSSLLTALDSWRSLIT